MGLSSPFLGSTLVTSSLWFPLCLRSEVLNWFGVRPPNKAKGAKTNIRLNISKMPYNCNSYHNEYVTTKMEHEFPNFKQFCHRELKWDIDVVSGFTVGEGGEQTLPPSTLPHYFPDSGDLDAIYCTPLNYLSGGVSPLIKEWWTSVSSHLPGPWTKFQNFAACADDLSLSLLFTVSYHLMGRILLKWWFNSISFTCTTRRGQYHISNHLQSPSPSPYMQGAPGL